MAEMQPEKNSDAWVWKFQRMLPDQLAHYMREHNIQELRLEQGSVRILMNPDQGSMTRFVEDIVQKKLDDNVKEMSEYFRNEFGKVVDEKMPGMMEEIINKLMEEDRPPIGKPAEVVDDYTSEMVRSAVDRRPPPPTPVPGSGKTRQ